MEKSDSVVERGEVTNNRLIPQAVREHTIFSHSTQQGVGRFP
jgi:hypothetical protein